MVGEIDRASGRAHKDGPAALAVIDVSKRYPNGVTALKHATFEVRPGEVHGVAGANGAGKSTLVKILGGATSPDSGRVLMRGSSESWRSPRDAMRRGVITMHQHAELLPRLEVIENVFLGARGLLRRSAGLMRRYEQLTSEYGIWVDPLAEAGTLSTGQQQMVSLLQALSSKPSVLILDEPTASLGDQEKRALFSAIGNLRTRDVGIVLVSHFLDELIGETDRLTVLRDGRTLGTFPSQEVTPDALAALITGGPGTSEAMAQARSDRVREGTASPESGERGLRLLDLSVPASVQHADLEIPAGQVLGVAGLLGSGRSELLQAIFGARGYDGEIRLGDHLLKGSIAKRIEKGVGFVPEDRNTQGLFRDWDIARNVSIPWIGRGRVFFGPVDRTAEREEAENAIARLAIRADGPGVGVSMLSGGNAQKVVVGRWLVREPRLLLLDEPMRGIDIGARREIGGLIREMADRGAVVIVVDSELTNLLEVCDRVIALHHGRLVLDEPVDRLTEHRLLLEINGIASTSDEMRSA